MESVQNKNENKYSLNNSKDLINRLKNQASSLKSSITNKNQINSNENNNNNKNKVISCFQFEDKENMSINKHIKNELSHCHLVKGINIINKHDTFEIDHKKYVYGDKNKFNKNSYFFNEKNNNSNNLSNKNYNNKDFEMLSKIKNLKTFHPTKLNDNNNKKSISIKVNKENKENRENNQNTNTNTINNVETNFNINDNKENILKERNKNISKSININKSRDKIKHKERNNSKMMNKEKKTDKSEKEKENQNKYNKKIDENEENKIEKEKVNENKNKINKNEKNNEIEHNKEKTKQITVKQEEKSKNNDMENIEKIKEENIKKNKDKEKDKSIKNKIKEHEKNDMKEKENIKNNSRKLFPLKIENKEEQIDPEEKIIYFDISNINNVQIPKDYLNIIYYNLLNEENIELVPKPIHTYMKNQKEINDQMRSILVDWIIDVHHKFGFTDETLFMTVLIIDRYCSVEQVTRIKYQCLGITALMIACKHEEINVPKVDDFIYITDNAYTKDEVFKMENDVLSKLNFSLLYPSPIKFYEYLSLHFNFNKKNHMLGKYLMESFLLDLKYIKYKPSIISCACTYIVMKFFKMTNYRESYDKKFYLIDENVNTITSGFGVKDCAQDICVFVDNINNTNLLSCQKKYTKSEFESVSALISNTTNKS